MYENHASDTTKVVSVGSFILGPVYTKTFSSRFQWKPNDGIASTHCFRIVSISFSAVYMKTMTKIENGKN